MALQWFEGWDLYTTATALQSITGGLWPASAGGANIIVTTAQARTGTRSLRLLGNGAFYAQRNVADPATDIFVGAAYYAENYSDGTDPTNANKGLGIHGATSNLRIVRTDNSGTHALYRGSTLVASFGVPTLTVATWHYFCLYYNKSTGAVRVYVDRALRLSTTVTTIGAISFIRYGSMGNAPSGSSEEFLDDVFAWNDPSGTELTNLEATADFSVVYGLPDANVAPQNWAVNVAPSAFEAVNNVPPNTENIEAAAVGNESRFNIPSLQPGVFAVFSVKHQYYSLKTTAGAGTVQGSIISNTTESLGANNVQTTTSQYFEDYYATDPATGVAWLPAALASLDVQYERTA